MSREVEINLKKNFKNKDSLFKGPDGKYYESPDDLKDAERKGNHFRSPLTGKPYEQSYRMHEEESEFFKKNR